MQQHLIAGAILLAGLAATPVGPRLFGSTPFGFRPPQTNQRPPVFSIRSELVVLHVLVKDKRGSFVPGLSSSAFSILEDGQPQTVQLFGDQDSPVSVGLLIDSSGSMRPVREHVIAAATTFAQTSNPADEVFALAFNDYVTPALPHQEPFTSDPERLRRALNETIRAAGRTAMYDAVAAGLAYLMNGTHERRVLVVVSDGGDNASTTTFDEALRRIQASNTVIYTVALVDPLDMEANPKRLRTLADASGGEAFTPRDVTHVQDVLRRIASDIRHAYTLGYVSTNPVRDGRLRRIQVVAKSADGRPLVVRTRRGYTVEKEPEAIPGAAR